MTGIRLQVFKAGHYESAGATHAFSRADIDSIASTYAPGLHAAPVTFGQPEHDHPAYGWVGALAGDDGRLVASLRHVDPSFAHAVKGGRYEKIVASFYLPESRNNPSPGTHYLRHVEVHGAQGVAAPKGPAPQFAASDDGFLSIEFGEQHVEATSSGEVATRAATYRGELSAKGIQISATEAVEHVLGRQPLGFAEAGDGSARELSTRARSYRADMAARGIAVTATQAVEHVLSNR